MFAAVLLLGTPALNAQTPTWSGEIANIIYSNCTSCHRPGEIGPFSLTSYEEASAWSYMVAHVTEERIMPPWKPDPDYSSFFGERVLSQDQITALREWADAGAPEGDPAQAPPLPEFPTGSQLGTPDLVLTMSEPYRIEGDYQDDYRIFVIPTGFTEPKEIAAIEFRPGNANAVHHVLIAYENSGNGALLDAVTPEYGYPSFGDFRVPTLGIVGGYTPGIETIPYPEGIGKVLPAGTDLLVQVHYAPIAAEEWDQSTVNIFFKEPDDEVNRCAVNFNISPGDLYGGYPAFRVLPNEITNFHATQLVEEDISLLSIQPHSHYLGTSYLVYAITPDGSNIPIIRIRDWDFNWQGTYTFRQMIHLPAGTVLHSIATYDNTSDNPYNPNSPPQLVDWGERSADEMMLVRLQSVSYRPGDEDLIIETGFTEVLPSVDQSWGTLFPIVPNPAVDQAELPVHLEQPAIVRLSVYNANGALVKLPETTLRLGSGFHTIPLDLKDLPEGMYLIVLEGEQFRLTQRLVVVH